MKRGVALVTGASGAFGSRICASLVARGFRVLATMRDPSRADVVRDAVRDLHFDPDDASLLEVVRLDVNDAEAVEALAGDILRGGAPVDVLVNNAGVMIEGFAEEVGDDALRAVLETNFVAATRLTRALVGPMRERRQGRVINISSVGGRFATPGHAAYHASKFALEGWSESLRYELAPFNVFVSLVEPGLAATEMFRNGLRRLGPGADGRGPYARVWAGLRRASDRALARPTLDPRAVGEHVARVALADRPRLRHPIGVDAWASVALGSPLMNRIWEQTVNRWART